MRKLNKKKMHEISEGYVNDGIIIVPKYIGTFAS